MKKAILGISIVTIAAIIAIVVIVGCHDQEKNKPQINTVKIEKANIRMAEFLQDNLVEAQRLYSVRNGGGGKRNFADSPQKLKGFASTKAIAATYGNGNPIVPADGYVVRMQEYPAEDAFRTGYKLEIEPASGFEGETFIITKQYTNKDERNEK